MKTLSLLLLSITLLMGCEQITEDVRLTDMKSHVILIGKSYNQYVHVAVLKDKNGKILSLYGSPIAQGLYSRSIGDTIK